MYPMGCLFYLLTLIGPRLGLAYLWIFTTLVDRAYDSVAIPILGFIFMPWTTMTYALAYDGDSVSSIGWMFVVFAVIADISSHAASARQSRRMRPV